MQLIEEYEKQIVIYEAIGFMDFEGNLTMPL
jgi:hypothetical protein